MMDCLIRLGLTKPSPTVMALLMGLETAAEPSQLSHVHRRLRHLQSSLRSINLTVEPLTPGPDQDACLMWQLEKQVSCINAGHSDLTRDILSIEQEDRDLLDLSIQLLLKSFSTRAYKQKDCSVIRLPLHQPTGLKVASNCQR